MEGTILQGVKVTLTSMGRLIVLRLDAYMINTCCLKLDTHIPGLVTLRRSWRNRRFGKVYTVSYILLSSLSHICRIFLYFCCTFFTYYIYIFFVFPFHIFYCYYYYSRIVVVYVCHYSSLNVAYLLFYNALHLDHHSYCTSRNIPSLCIAP